MGLDLLVIIIYMTVVIVLGLRYSGASSLNDYFLGNRSVHWVLACLSIVATETSSLSFLSIPGVAYTQGMGFFQISIGYLLGRVVVAFLLLPHYFRGNVQTVYEFLETKFSSFSRKTISVVFHVTRILSDAVRLFATAIPLTVLMGWDIRISLLVIGAGTFIYTFYGGIRSVIVVDSLQLLIYFLCVVMGMVIIATDLSPSVLFERLMTFDTRVFSPGTEKDLSHLFHSYNIFSGVLGGAFLSFASHGTDHIIVQRVLSCRDAGSAGKAMIASGIIIIVQFLLFLLFGLFIKALLNARTFSSSDEVVPYFIVNCLPAGFRGIALAGIFASAMSTLSSSINSLSSSTAIDLLGIHVRKIDEARKVRYSRMISLGWTIVLIMVSILFEGAARPLVEVGLSISSVTYGGVMGIFVMGVLFERVHNRVAIGAVAAGISTNIALIAFTDIFWLWYVIIGFSVTMAAAFLFNRLADGSKNVCGT